MNRPRTVAAVPAPLLVLVAIASVQTGSAVARTAFDVTGASGVTLMRLAIAGLLLTAWSGRRCAGGRGSSGARQSRWVSRWVR